MQIPAPIRAPGFLSRRRLFEQKLTDLPKCTDLKHLKQMHALIYKSNLHGDPFVAPKLISAFSLCRQMALAVNVFDQIPSPNANLFNALIKAYIKNFEPDRALEVFCRMRWSGVSPDTYTHQFVLKACSDLRSVGMTHAQVEKYGLHSNVFTSNSMIDAYFKCGTAGAQEARKIFDEMGEKDLVTYNSMISGLLRACRLHEAQNLFDQMPQRDAVSWNIILDGYSKAGNMSQAFELFQKMPSRDVISWATIISGFAQAGDAEMAKALFDCSPSKNLVTWTIMICGYAKKGLAKDAIELYHQMEAANVRPDDSTFVSILSASAESGLLCLGKNVHQSVTKNRSKCGVLVSNALIDMYCKCGSLKQAWRVFSLIEKKDLISWNTMIHGLAVHGQGLKALRLFNQMRSQGFVPNKVTFVSILSACSHSGLIDDGMCCFYSMQSDYRIRPEIEHYGCVINLLGRGGRFIEAFRILCEMPFEPNVVIWSSLLGACKMHNATRLAEEVLDQVLKLGPPMNVGTYYPVMSSVYTSVGQWPNVADVKAKMRRRASGVSSIDLDGRFHGFKVMDGNHPRSERIYETVDGLNKHLGKDGCVPEVVG